MVSAVVRVVEMKKLHKYLALSAFDDDKIRGACALCYREHLRKGDEGTFFLHECWHRGNHIVFPPFESISIWHAPPARETQTIGVQTRQFYDALSHMDTPPLSSQQRSL